MKSFFNFLSVRLFLFVMGTTLLIFGVHIYLDIRITSENLINSVKDSADRTGELIKNSTRYSMLLNRKGEVREIIRDLGSHGDFVGINVYNKAGEIVFSTDSSAVGSKVDFYAEACVVCHSGELPLRAVPDGSRVRVYEAPDKQHILGVIHPIRNEPACYEAECHVHGPDETTLGVLDVKMSLGGVDELITQSRNAMILSSLFMAILVSAVSGLFLYRVVQKPIGALSVGMDTIAGGDLTARLDYDSATELGKLSRSFNKMADDLSEARREVREWANTLEDRIAKKTEELEQVQEQMIHMEKMASLGQLSASVAHEINNPLFGILTYAKLSGRELEHGSLDDKTVLAIKNHLSVIQREAIRCGDIVKNLLDFARPTGGDFALYRLNESIEHTLRLLEPHLSKKQIAVQTNFTKDIDEVTCDANQCQQAMLAICLNAIESMPDGGRLTVGTRREADHFTIEIGDTGHGIPEESIPRIFEPFYTSKTTSAGRAGYGLGLSVAYGIIQRHRGKIDVSSTVGKGTTFTITIPLEQNPEWRI